MKPSMEAALGKALESSAEDFVSLVAQHQSRGDKFIIKCFLSKCSLQCAHQICDALASTTDLALDSYRKLLEQQQQQAGNVDEQQQAGNVDEQHGDNVEQPQEEVVVQQPSSEQSSSPPKQRTRSRRLQEKNRIPEAAEVEATSLAEEMGNTEMGKVLKTLHSCVFLAHVSVTEGIAVMEAGWLFPTVLSLHDSLVLLEGDPNLQESIAGLCELWWRENLEQRESLIVQCLPFLMSKALAWGRKKDLQRLYGMRSALVLFDFYDDSIKDMKHLLIRTVVTPAFLRMQPGRRFISFLFGLDPQLVKELIVIVRSQIPYGRKSILEAYGEILYQAWKGAEGPCLHEIEFTCIQGLFEATLYASSKSLGAAVRTVLEGFAAQKAQDGVESMLFWLLEPLLFRALQAANSNVRQNALLVLVDVFPLEDPAASKEEKEAVLEKQFGLLDKLLMDPCPDVRSVAVKVVCRILRLFWEIIPSAETVRLLTKVVGEVSCDCTSNSVRIAVLQGVIYLLENAQSHALLKALLPSLGPMLNDTCLTVRIATADLLLVIKGIPIIQFYKVVPLETVLSSLADDNSLVARRVTSLLLHSYFPPQVPVKEACKRCMVLLKRAPQAGAKFCKWLLDEGASPKSLLQLAQNLIRSVKSEKLTQEVQTGTILAISELCQKLVTVDEYRTVIEEILNGDMLATLMGYASDSLARSYVLQIAAKLPPKDISKLVAYCCDLSMRCPITPSDVEEVSSVHTLVLAWGGLEEVLEALIGCLSEPINLPHDASKVANDHVTSRQSKNVESAWSRVLASSPSEPLEVGKTKNALDRFIKASGAAWQVEMLLEGEETRVTVLTHGHFKELMQSLRALAQIVLNRAGDGSLNLAITCHPASIVLAYMKLYIHIALKGSDRSEQQENTSTSGRRGQKPSDSSSSPVESDQISDGFEAAWEELVGWLRDMLTKQSGSQIPPPASPSQRKAKHPRRKLRSREPLSPLPPNMHPGSNKKAKNNEDRAAAESDWRKKNKEAISTLISETAQIISDSFTLGLVSSPSLRQVSADLVTDSIEWLSQTFSSEQGADNSCLPPGWKERWAKYVKSLQFVEEFI